MSPVPPPIRKIGDVAEAAGIRRINILAWRDLEDPEAGGSELHIHEVARRWAEAGIVVTMRTSYAPGRAPELVRDGYRVIRRAGRYSVFPRSILSQRLGRHGPADALVEIWNGVPFLSPLWYPGRRLVLLHHVHGEMFNMVLPGSLGTAGRFIERRLAPPFYRRTQIATLSGSSRDEIVGTLRLRPDRVAVVPPGIDEAYQPAPARRSATPLIVACGRLVPVKRHDLLIRAAHEARQRVPGLTLRILGEGSDRPMLIELIHELDAEDWVELPGFVEAADLLAAYQEAWVVASASHSEGWGMTLTDAAACGTPAVATDIPGHRDSVDSGRTGILVPPAELGTALADLMRDHDTRARLGDAALVHAASFGWDRTALELLELLATQ